MRISPFFVFFSVFSVVNCFLSPLHAAERDSLRIVTREELAQAMRQHGPYDVTKTTNAGRLQAETLLALVRRAQAGDPDRRPLFISHKDWFEVYLEVAGLKAGAAPIFARLGYEYGQDVRIERRPERVIRNIKGSQPQAALHVTIWWEASPSKRDRYSYEDTLSVPRLQVTDHRVITYRMLDFGDMIVLDDIEGLTGRPTTGLLGFLFRLIGEGRLVETRIAVSPDGLQVLRGRAEKGFFDVTTTATIYPDGHGIKDLPDGRVDLLAIEARLKREIEVEYVPVPQESR
ncbi:MAG: hypothetical protein A3F84_10025 [Candidatus Handelsmanbacteria bacterium RIFCSPLOWO2_12_FULL_64_10]|uniref:Uncharacterized protein n=1 Tax=Handelsmanbacteria sp. (strain RIFCSPLOWO2_12_FULL_64_10) TaxID=1817868 RepID=A0A1F6CUA7_HANXR|nr:MAG: hypothetical protein A3F84_10025 [Candidatus Handelsmanbacteria bacterium RIFCSPLOWO2_12_FULL_64_10]